MATGAAPGRASPTSPAPRWSSPPRGSEERDREIAVARARGRRPGQRRRPSRALRFLHAGDRQPRAARGRDRQRGRRAGALPPCPRPHRGAAGAGLRRPRRPRRAAPRARRAGASPSGADRRRFWARFFSGPVAEKVFAGAHRRGRERGASACSRSTRTCPATCRWSAPGPGAEDLLTLRAQRALQEADVIVYDRLVPEAIVAQGRRDARRIYVGKAKGEHALSQDEINALIVARGAARPPRRPPQVGRSADLRPGRRGDGGAPRGGHLLRHRARHHRRLRRRGRERRSR